MDNFVKQPIEYVSSFLGNEMALDVVRESHFVDEEKR